MQELCKVLYPLENTTKLNKDMMLALLLEGTGQNLTLGSVQVCRRAQIRILGIGEGRSSRLKKGHPDDRFGARPKGDPRGPTSIIYGQLYSHLWHVYSSLAEHMPDQDILVDEINPLAPVPDSAKKNVASFRAAQDNTNNFAHAPSSTNGMLLQPTEDCPRRWMPPGSKRDIWWTYVASCRASEKPVVGSYRTLVRVWKECFAAILGFCSFGKHPKCTLCHRSKERIKNSPSYADKLEASKALNDHREVVWRDRLIYWRIRSHATHEGAYWLCIIIDGADQAKFSNTPKVWRANTGHK